MDSVAVKGPGNRKRRTRHCRIWRKQKAQKDACWAEPSEPLCDAMINTTVSWSLRAWVLPWCSE
jgi:hypothetical protein